jgi:hypothetical protein
MGYYVKGQIYLIKSIYRDIKKCFKKRKKRVKYHKNGLPIETRYKEEDYKYYK